MKSEATHSGRFKDSLFRRLKTTKWERQSFKFSLQVPKEVALPGVHNEHLGQSRLDQVFGYFLPHGLISKGIRLPSPRFFLVAAFSSRGYYIFAALLYLATIPWTEKHTWRKSSPLLWNLQLCVAICWVDSSPIQWSSIATVIWYQQNKLLRSFTMPTDPMSPSFAGSLPRATSFENHSRVPSDPVRGVQSWSSNSAQNSNLERKFLEDISGIALASIWTDREIEFKSKNLNPLGAL